MKRSSIVLLQLCCVSLFFGTGCSSLMPSMTQLQQQKQRIFELESELKKQKIMADQLKEKNFVLSSRATSCEPVALRSPEVPVAFSSSVEFASQPPSRAIGSTPPEERSSASVMGTRLPEIEVKSTEEKGEHYLYAKAIETYRKKSISELRKTLTLFSKTYPQSTFYDNALYLFALLNFETAEYARANSACDELLSRFPQSEKIASALLLKARSQMKLKNMALAKDFYLKIQSYFSGSEEAQIASHEIGNTRNKL